MNPLFLILAVALHGSAEFQPLHPTQPSGCPAATAQGLRVMDVFTNAERYAAFKSRYRLRASTQIGTVKDALACERLRAVLTTHAREAGANFTSAGVEFYEDANYYYAVIPAPPSRCTPGPDHACLSTRWQSVRVFDRNFTFISGAAI